MTTTTLRPRIIIDSREQRPYDFPESETIHKALPAGDYSIEGLETRFAIERKTMDDLINTMLRGKRRFARELRKLQSYDFAAVIVEGSLADILAGDYTSQIAPAALLGMVCGLALAYHPVHVWFAHDRPHAVALVSEIIALAAQRWGMERTEDQNAD